jgi:hypothetical protein
MRRRTPAISGRATAARSGAIERSAGWPGYAALVSMSDRAYTVLREEEGQAPGLAPWSGEDSPVSHEARIETGFLLRRLQQGERCPRRFKSDPPCRLNSDPGAGVDRVMVDCG